MPIPNLDEESGELPEGIHEATLEEVKATFGQQNDRRKVLMAGLTKAVTMFKDGGVKYVLVDGSFTTSREFPADVDGCWSATGVTEEGLKLIDSDFWDFKDMSDLMVKREKIKQKYGLDFYIAEFTEGKSGIPFSDFFKKNREGKSKGIVKINLNQERL